MKGLVRDSKRERFLTAGSETHRAERAAPHVLPLLRMQQTHGNRFVQRLLAGRPADSVPLGFGRPAAKLAVSQPQDDCEREADRVADQVMQQHAPAAVRSGGEPAMQPMCADCEDELQRKEVIEEALTEEEETIQAKAGVGVEHGAAASVEAGLHSLAGRGEPLAEATRAFFEPRFGYSFGQVRVHTDTGAAGLARSVNALAFTYGPHIVFNQGQYAPESVAGRHLLAHELTHVIQQGSAEPSVMRSPGCDCAAVGGRNPSAAELSDARGKYPRLVDGDWCVTGPATGTYNCIAWTIGVTSRWVWDEVDAAGDGDGTVSISDFDAFYRGHGLRPVENQTPTNAEVALFADGSGPTHAARRTGHSCSAGVLFESKRGRNIRIMHPPHQLEGGIYGDIVKYYVLA